MRLVTTVLIAVLVGVGLGYATTVAEFGLSTDLPVLDRPAVPTGPVAKAFVNNPVHDFGTMLLYEEGEHRFLIENHGTADLKIAKKKTSCKCTISELSRTVIPPGESAEITVSWKTSVSWRKKKFSQTARIGTNDPTHPEIVLRVEGNLLPEHRFADVALQFNPVAQHDTRELETQLYFYTHPAVEIVEVAGQESEAKQHLQINYRPLDKEELQDQHGDADTPNEIAKCGYAITVTLKPGLEPKRYFHAVTLRTQPHMQQTLRLPISVIVKPDIYVQGFGARFNTTTRLLDMGTLKPGQEYAKKMHLFVVGDQRQGVEFEVREVVPKQLQVTIGAVEDLGNGTVRRPLQVRLSETTTPLDLLGGPQGSLGHVLLGSTHPYTAEYRFVVRVAIKEGTESVGADKSATENFAGAKLAEGSVAEENVAEGSKAEENVAEENVAEEKVADGSPTANAPRGASGAHRTKHEETEKPAVRP